MNPSAPAATTSQQALQQLQQYQSSEKNPNQFLNDANQQYGVNAAQDTLTGLRGAITNTTNMLNKVAPSVMGRTQNSLVTDAQANRQIANESAPLQQTLTKQGTDYTNATQDYDRAASQAQNAAGLSYGAQKDQQSYLQDLYDRLYGGEQDAAKAAEQKREFDATLAANKAAAAASNSGGINDLINSLMNQPTALKANEVTSGFKNGKNGTNGSYFMDKNGTAISAASYAAAKGLSLPTLLSQMSAAGDSGATSALAALNSGIPITDPSLHAFTWTGTY